MTDDYKAWLLALERIWLTHENGRRYQQPVRYFACRRILAKALTKNLAGDKLSGHDERDDNN